MPPSSNDLSYQYIDTILDRFCLEILPIIHDKIEWLDVESSAMENILLSTNYPNLHGLNRSFLIRVFKNQILSLVIDINKCKEPRCPGKDINIFIFTQIFAMFSNLQHLNFGSSSGYQQLTFNISSPLVFSSSLLELHVVVDSCNECFYLLDNRFS
ncbi:unnamed protein product [Rotaria sp. Silwood2]|nr:unnamed protein product [Rotaria sp. Silwood2]CAF4263194.1 unnamed protein product [Rotaria sp. Silwood2]